jgi:hypothetical protein
MTVMESRITAEPWELRRKAINAMIKAAPAKDGFGHVHVHDLAGGVPYHAMADDQRAAIWSVSHQP